ncbi:Phosphatidylinositol-3-phosphatase SAC1 [Saitoella coloradoensis]
MSSGAFDVEALVEAPFKNDEVKDGTPDVAVADKPHDVDRERERASSRHSHTSSSRRRERSSSRHSSHRSSRSRDRDRGDRRDRERSRDRGGDRYRSSSSRYDDRDNRDNRDRRGADSYRSSDRDRDSRRDNDRRDRDRYDGRDSRYDGDRRSYLRSESRRDDRPTSDSRRRSRSPAVDRNRDERPKLTEEQRDRRTVFVQQLAARLRTKELIEFFEKGAGPVQEAQIVKDRISGRSKGVGYVEFKDEATVPKAINLTGQKLLGIPIIAQLTEAEKNRLAKAEGNAARPSEIPFHRLYVGNIHFSLTEEDLRTVFEPFGQLEFVQLQKEHDTGRSRGYGFVQYQEPSSARDALEKMNGFELAGRPIRVGLGNDKFTPESTAAALARFSTYASAYVPRDTRGRGGEKIGGGGGNVGGLDDSDALGVSFSNISRDALMRKLAREEDSGQENGGKGQVEAASGVVSAARPAPEVMASRCVLLKNMFDPAEESGENWQQELAEDVKSECESKFGKVVHIHVEDSVRPGEIYVKFETVGAGERAILGLNGRFFGGRTVAVSPVIDAVYHARFGRAKAL